jgi:hypothetical protein
MSALTDGQKTRFPIVALFQRLRDWSARVSGVDLDICGDESVAEMAHDAGLSVSELRHLAKLGPDAADLLGRRMAELDVNQNLLARNEPQTLHDLQRLCSLCQVHRRCARDLAHDPEDPGWKDYCPNVGTLTALAAVPQTPQS